MIKRKKTLQSDAMNHNNKCCHSAHNDEQQQHAAAAAAACSSSCSNISIATHRAAAAEIHGRYIETHTRTSYSSAHLSSRYNLSGPGNPLRNHPHGAQQKELEKENGAKRAEKESPAGFEPSTSLSEGVQSTFEPPVSVREMFSD